MSKENYPCTLTELDRRSFVEWPLNGKLSARRVKIIQGDGEALKVELGVKGVSRNVYNEISNITSEIETLVTTYTVPIGKKFDLSRAVCSGDNIARFTIKVNGSILQGKRTWWSDFNTEFNVDEDILNAGEKVEIFVTNRGIKSADFEATIIGGEYDE